MAWRFLRETLSLTGFKSSTDTEILSMSINNVWLVMLVGSYGDSQLTLSLSPSAPHPAWLAEVAQRHAPGHRSWQHPPSQCTTQTKQDNSSIEFCVWKSILASVSKKFHIFWNYSKDNANKSANQKYAVGLKTWNGLQQWLQKNPKTLLKTLKILKFSDIYCISCDSPAMIKKNNSNQNAAAVRNHQLSFRQSFVEMSATV